MKVGLIGDTGKVGKILAELIKQNDILGTSFNRKSPHSINEVFSNNDYIVDFSHASLTQNVIECVLKYNKPTIICTTNWANAELLAKLKEAAALAPIVIAPNTSIGASIQRHLARQVVQLSHKLNLEFDVDILEVHHRHKKDSPSGTAEALFAAIQEEWSAASGSQYNLYTPSSGPRPSCSIALTSQRMGNIPGVHDVSFTGHDEAITIKHTAFNRDVFAKGAMQLLRWVHNAGLPNGLYSMDNYINYILNQTLTL